jgi:hypothetical protein
MELHELLKFLFPAGIGAGGLGSFLILAILIANKIKWIPFEIRIGRNGKPKYLTQEELEKECLKKHTPIDQAIAKMTQMQMSIDGVLIDIHAELREGNKQFGRIEERIERIEKKLFTDNHYMVK